ncbi:MAG: hypothetical protein JXA03_12535 [Bacteroidales bacterium]|nr:hypothetical protein [Bacteroidales bacterium]
MQTVLVELRDQKAFEELHNLEAKKLIRIITENGPASSYALPGDPVSVEDFRKWVEHAENTPTISLTQAKKQWQAQKKKLQQPIR